jgi:hypothetical protein
VPPADECIEVRSDASGLAGADVPALAGQLHTLCLQIARAEFRPQAVAAARAGADMLRAAACPGVTERLLFGGLLHALVNRLVEADRAEEAKEPAEECVTVRREASVLPGANVPALAGQLHTLCLQIALPALREQAIAAARAGADILRPAAGSDPAQQSLLGALLHALVNRLIDAGRTSEAREAAAECVAVRRLCSRLAGADVPALAGQLHTLSAQTALPALREEAVAAARAGADMMRERIGGGQPTVPDGLLHGLLLHALVLRLIDAARPADAAAPADESIQVRRRTATSPGADARGVAGQLHTLSLQVARPELRVQAIDAAEAAADVLRAIAPALEGLAAHLLFTGTVLQGLTSRLIEGGRLDAARARAREVIEVLQRAASAGADHHDVRTRLVTFAGVLGGAGLREESAAATAAAAAL